MEKKFVRLFRGRLAVIARHRDGHVGRQQCAPHFIDFAHHRADHIDRVGPGLLGHAQGHRRLDALSAHRLINVSLRFLRTVDNLRHIAQINRPSLVDTDHHLTGFGCTRDEATGFDENGPVLRGDRPGPRLPVALLQHGNDPRRRNPPRSHTHRIEDNADLTLQSADECGLRYQRDLLHRILQFRAQTPQFHRALHRAVQCQGKDRNVVDRPRLDQRHGHAVRDAVEIGLQLLVEFDDAVPQIRTDLEPHDDQALART